MGKDTEKILAGQRFGRLTVLEKTDQRQDRYVLWRCRCDCGNEILVNTKHLKRGTKKDCGCIPKSSARNGAVPEDLTGQVFGDLTVLYREKNQNNRTCWMCRCTCGNTRIVQSRFLKSGEVTHCGCKKKTKYPMEEDLTGKKFGRLTVLYPCDVEDEKQGISWHCRCDCGNELDVPETGLIYGNNKSCGCLKKEVQQNIFQQLHLIDGTCLEWITNRKHRSDNTSGFRGVSRTGDGKYRVGIGFKKKRYYLGRFADFEEAVAAREEAEELIYGNFIRAYERWQEKVLTEDVSDGEEFVFEVEKVNGQLNIITNMRD